MGLIRMGPPEDLILKLATEFNIENFVETGTYEGATAVWAAKNFQKVSTIEMSRHLYEAASQKLGQIENIEFVVGDSRTELAGIVNNLEKAAVFWLDAHWSGGATYGNDDQCPILEEIEIINESAFDNFIFIDDARLFTSPSPPPHKTEQWADIASMIAALRKNLTDKYIVIIEDVIIAVPLSARAIVAEYCRNVNAEMWEQYGLAQQKTNFRKGAALIYANLPEILKRAVRKSRQFYDFLKNRSRRSS